MAEALHTLHRLHRTLVIIHHLLLTGEEYTEKTVKRKHVRIIKPSDLKVPLEDAIALLNRAGFMTTDYG